MKVVITVDVEPSIAGALRDSKFTPLIHEPVAGNINGKSEALGFLINLMRQYNFMATFFVETVHNSYFSSDIMEKYVSQLCVANQDVQLHIHPVWEFFRKNVFVSDDSSDHSPEFIAKLLAMGKDYIKQWTGKYPIALRTGRFSVGNNVYHAMNMVDLKISSNICVSCFKPQEPELYLTHGIHNIFGVTELPATCFQDNSLMKRNGLRSLQITAISGTEMTSVLDKMEKQGHEVAVIVTHPFEFLKTKDFRYSNMRINKIVQNRAKNLCEYLDKHRDRFQVVPLSQAATSNENHNLKIVKGNPVLSFLRSATNFINDRI